MIDYCKDCLLKQNCTRYTEMLTNLTAPCLLWPQQEPEEDAQEESESEDEEPEKTIWTGIAGVPYLGNWNGIKLP